MWNDEDLSCCGFLWFQGQLSSTAPVHFSFFTKQQIMPWLVHYTCLHYKLLQSVLWVWSYCHVQGQIDFRPANVTYKLQVFASSLNNIFWIALLMIENVSLENAVNLYFFLIFQENHLRSAHMPGSSSKQL